MQEHVYPNERRFYDEIEENTRKGARWTPTRIVEDLKVKARAAGLWNLFLPDSPYGPGLKNIEYAPLAEIMGRVPWASEVFNCNAPDTGNMETIERYGTPEQKKQWLEPLLAGDIRSGFAMTEPGVASSDATNIQTEIRRDGDHYVINERKWWTSGAGDPRCKVYIVMGKTDPTAAKHQQQSMILVPPTWLSLQPEQAIALLSFSYFGVSLLAGIADYWQTILLSGLGNRIIYSFRNKAFDYFFRLLVSFHEKRTVGELVTRIVYDISRLRRGVNGILIRTFQVVFTFILNVVVILLLNWHIAIVIGAIGTLALLLMNRNGKRILSESRKNRRREGQLAAVVSEDMHGIREFQTFRPDHLTDDRFDKRNIKSLASEQKVRRIAARIDSVPAHPP